MIPVAAFVRFRRRDRRSFGFWLPLILIWLLLLPLILVLLPILVILLASARARPFRTLGALWSLLSGLRGTHIEIDSNDQTLLIHIY